LWDKDGVKAIDLPYQKLIHHVVIISHDEKNVSSSEAHQRVTSSHLFEGRPQRAEENLKMLLESFQQKNWKRSYEIVWQEFSDMHQLFETAKQPFKYINDDSQFVLNYLQQYWGKAGDGPLVTMDAGPNIHLLFRDDQHLLADEMRNEFVGNYDVI